MLKIEQIKKVLVINGWIKDSHGNFKKETHGKQYRYKFNAQSYRKEVYDAQFKRWIKVGGMYYKQVTCYLWEDINGREFGKIVFFAYEEKFDKMLDKAVNDGKISTWKKL